MGTYIRTLTVYTDMEILPQEIPAFRGAVLHALGDQANILFHNHSGENTFRYSYPLIQYKRLNRKAAIVCVEEAVDLIGQLLTNLSDTIMIGSREVEWHTNRIQPARLLVQTWDTSFPYHINHWLPLNTHNYNLYKNTEGVVERVALLENILKANLLSMLKGLNIHLEQELILKITQISDPHLIKNKGVKMMAFNADFNCNLSIPNNLGIGKNASIGYGIIHQEKTQKTETKDS